MSQSLACQARHHAHLLQNSSHDCPPTGTTAVCLAHRVRLLFYHFHPILSEVLDRYKHPSGPLTEIADKFQLEGASPPFPRLRLADFTATMQNTSRILPTMKLCAIAAFCASKTPSSAAPSARVISAVRVRPRISTMAPTSTWSSGPRCVNSFPPVPFARKTEPDILCQVNVAPFDPNRSTAQLSESTSPTTTLVHPHSFGEPSSPATTVVNSH